MGRGHRLSSLGGGFFPFFLFGMAGELAPGALPSGVAQAGEARFLSEKVRAALSFFQSPLEPARKKPERVFSFSGGERGTECGRLFFTG